MNHLAAPAPKVEAAIAARAPEAEAATTEAAGNVEQAIAAPPSRVEPALLEKDVNAMAPIDDSDRNKQLNLSTQVLRSSGGTDFEGVAAVLRGAPEKNFLKRCLPLFFDERDFVSFGEVSRYVVVKGGCCFIFADCDDPSPLYGIPLDEVYPVMENPKKMSKHSVTVSPTARKNAPKDQMRTVLLKYREDNSQAYQFTFDTKKTPGAPKQFYDVVDQSKKAGGVITASVVQPPGSGKMATKNTAK